MTSTINYLSINENFPVSGQDNDTQIFRDNFDTIKTSLRSANTEITTLQHESANITTDNDFGLNKIHNALLQNNREQKFDGGAITTSPTTIDFQNGSYQIYRLGSNVTFDFLNFPGDPVFSSEATPIGVGKVTLELYGATHIATFSVSSGTVIKKDSSFPATLTLPSTTNPVIIEVWRHSLNTIYMRYLGVFA